MSGPRVTSGTDSKQDYETPTVLIEAVESVLGCRITFDLAAHKGNTKHPLFYSPEDDSLSCAWSSLRGLLWLNPPFDDIAPWAKKCADESLKGAKIAFLTPAAVGANWYRDFVAPFADVYFMNGRPSFDGKNPYPKDCMLSIYENGRPHFNTIWQWKIGKMGPMWTLGGL